MTAMDISSFLGNDSTFGRVMTRCGTVIAINILFVISCVPVVTIGAAACAMYSAIYEMLDMEKLEKREHAGNAINPFRAYWRGLKRCFLRGTLCWLAFLGIMLLGVLNLRICAAAPGLIHYLSPGVIAVMIAAVILITHLLPTLAAVSGRISDMLRIAFCAAMSKPLRLILVLILNTVPLFLLLADEVNRPTYVFAGVFFWCGMTACIIGKRLRPSIEAFAG